MKLIIANILLIFLFSSCVKKDEYSNIPNISFNKIEQYKDVNGDDSLLRVFIDYSDGDGDIGLDSSNTESIFGIKSPYYYNLLVDFYDVVGGVESKRTFNNPADTFSYYKDTVHFHQRIKNITPAGKNKSISGTITMDILYLPLAFLTPAIEKSKFTFQLVDRKINKSNIISTPVY